MRRIQKLIKVLLPLAFGIGIVWFILQKVDMQLLIDTVKSGINWTWVVISWAFALLANVVRGIRWRQQLRTVGVNPSLHEMSISFFGNYGMNLVFPRLGEFWRCNYIAQNNRKPFSTIAGTILSERLCDILCSSFLILLALVLEGRVLVKFFFDDESKAEAIAAAGGEVRPATNAVMPTWAWVLVVLVTLFVLARVFRPKLRKMSFYQSLVSIGKNMWHGFLSLKDLPNVWSYVFWSALIWFLYFLNTLTQFYFFDFTSHLGLLACLTVFVMGTMSQLLPIQGGLGAWQAMVIFALLQYGIDNQHAIIFAVVAWILEQAFVLLMGLYAFVAVAIKKNKQT
jgi:uncharacterized membrane protein YbhN (UPF0104 family)